MSFKDRLLRKFKDDYKFTFSIVIAVYNTEEYLDETIQSIISQSFDFKRVQVILVDDGSTDTSGEICDKYVDRYPDNFICIHQENRGQSVARNNAMQYAQGRYINFLDSDDKLEENTLSEIYRYFKSWDGQIDVITIPRFVFGRENGPMLFDDKYKDSRIVDIREEFDFPQFSISAAFIKKEALTEGFNPDIIISEDSLLLNKIILKRCRFGVVGSCRYLYRKREDEDSTIDTRKTRKEYFSPRIELYLKELISASMELYGEVLKYIQSVMIMDLYWLFMQNSEAGVLDEQETEEFYSQISDVLQYIEDDIINGQYYRKSIKYRMLTLKYDNELEYEIENDYLMFDGDNFDRLANYGIFISDVDISGEKLSVNCYYEFYPVEFALKMYVDGKERNMEPKSVEKTISLGKVILNKYIYELAFDLDEFSEICFERIMDSKSYDVKLRHNNVKQDAIEITDYKIVAG